MQRVNRRNLELLRFRRIIVSIACIAHSAFCIAQLNTDRITAIGRNALYFDDYVLSIQYFNQVIKLKPYLAEPYLLRAIAKIQLNDYRGALRDCNASVERNPFLPGAYYTRGFVYMQLHDIDKAITDFSEALVFAPENKTYMLLRADMLSRAERYDEAMTDIDFLLRREPHSAELHYEKGVISLQSRDTLTAIDEFTYSTLYDSQNPANWSALGTAHLMMEQEEKALDELTKSINLGSRWAGDYINRGIILNRQHNYRGAMADYDKAVELSPNDAQCYFCRAALRQQLGDMNRALDDINSAIDLTPDQTEMYYQRGTILLQLRQWKEAIEDFDRLIAEYPCFLPSYYLAAQAKTALGQPRAALEYRKRAEEAEHMKRDSTSMPNTQVQVAKAQPQRRDRRKEFSSHMAQDQVQSLEEDVPYQSDTRGSIQRRYTDVVNCGNIVLSYYAKQDAVRRTRFYHYLVEQYNQQQLLPSVLQLTDQEIPLNADMVNIHFARISQLSHYLDTYESADMRFARAIEEAVVQDYASAIEDCTHAIQLCPDFLLAYFCRANWRYKLLEYQRATGTLTEGSKLDFEIMLRDYDYVILHQPDFYFAYYNKANLLCSQREYESAIAYYTQAIDLEPDMAEAWFNRGLTRIYIGQNKEGISDLSHAGELGMYQAYNLITRFE